LDQKTIGDAVDLGAAGKPPDIAAVAPFSTCTRSVSAGTTGLRNLALIDGHEIDEASPALGTDAEKA
jgi:hypothetical protein